MPPQIVSYVPDGLRSAVPPPPPEPPRRRVWLNILLFALTFLSTLYAQTPVHRDETFWQVIAVPWRDPSRLWVSLPFAVTLMAILLAHEMGHYLTARRYGVDQSLPYFIPAPIAYFGTLGAVILMRSQPRNRRVLLNVAVMGPYAGLALALPAAAWGLAHSIPVDPDSTVGALAFGDSLLFAGLERWFSPNGTDVILHPVAMAGWVGLFITSLNLIPAAQLDGGHIAYALFGRWHEKISLAVAVGLFYFGLHSACIGQEHGDEGGAMWLIWSLLLFVIGIRHPPVQDEALPLTFSQRLNGWVALALFVVTFIPVPIKRLQPLDPPDGDDDPGIESPLRPDNDEGERDESPSDSDDPPSPPAEEFKL